MNLKRWHIAVVTLFYFMSISLTAFITRMPEIKSSLAVDSSQLGLVLLAGALGSMVTLSFSGKLIARFGTKPIATFGYVFASAAIASASVSVANHSVLAVIISFFCGFAGWALADVSINVDGSQVEQKLERSVMPRMHAFYSLGAFTGAGIATIAITLGIDLVTQTVVLSVIQMAVPLVLWKLIPSHTGQDSHHADKSQVKADKYSPWKNPIIPLLGLGILGMTLVEGASNDWLVLGFKEGLGQTAANAGLAYVILQVGMVGSRFFGGSLVDKIGRRRTLELLAISGILGILLVTLTGNILLQYAGTVLWGAGVSMAFPLFLGAAGEGKNSAKNVGAVAQFGYASFLVGPPLLGVLAQNIGIINMFYLLIAFLAVSFIFARATDRVSKA